MVLLFCLIFLAFLEEGARISLGPLKQSEEIIGKAQAIASTITFGNPSAVR